MVHYFKVVYIKSTKEVEPIPHQWEEDGIVYWPPTKGQVRKMQSDACSIPDKKTWKKYDCLVKASNILLFMHASSQADQLCKDDSSSDCSTTDDEKRKIVPTKSFLTTSKQTSSALRKNVAGLPAYDFRHDKPKTAYKPTEVETLSELESSNENTEENTIINDPDVLEKLSLLETKVDKIYKHLGECTEQILETMMEKFAQMSVRLDNLEEVLKKTEPCLILPENEVKIFPIDKVPVLEKFEKDLEDKTFKNKVFIHLTRSTGSAMPFKTACYKLAGIMFTKQLLTKYSWTGMSRSQEKKAFNKLIGILNLFYKVIYKSDNSFTYPGKDSFFRDCILKHSNTRLKSTKKNMVVSATLELKEDPITENQDLQDSVDTEVETEAVGSHYQEYEILQIGEDGVVLPEDEPE